MVGSNVKCVSRLGVKAQHILHSVGLGRDDPRHTIGVVHLGADRVIVDELANWDEPGGGADERIVRLARCFQETDWSGADGPPLVRPRSIRGK